MFRKFLVLAAWSLLILIAYATMSPIHERPTLPTPSSVEHLLAFLALGALFYAAYPRRLAFACLIVLGSAVLLELLQLLTPDRHARVLDSIEKIVGGALGIIASGAVLHFEKAQRLLMGESTRQPDAPTHDFDQLPCHPSRNASVSRTAEELNELSSRASTRR